MKTSMRVRKSHAHRGKWEVLVVYMYDNGAVSRIVLCERDTYEEAMKVIQ